MKQFLNFFAENIILRFQNKKILKAIPSSFDTIVDVGSHHGELYNSFKKNKIKYNNFYMFEPNINSFEKLKNEINDLRVIKINKALSSSVSKKIFHINPMSMTSTLSKVNRNILKFRIKNLLIRDKNLTKEIQVETDILDNYKFDNSNCNLLKIDTEGHEMDVLIGAKNHILNRVFNYIVIEIQKPLTYEGYDPEEIQKFLISNSYKIIGEYKIPFLGFKDVVYKLI